MGIFDKFLGKKPHDSFGDGYDDDDYIDEEKEFEESFKNAAEDTWDDTGLSFEDELDEFKKHSFNDLTVGFRLSGSEPFFALFQQKDGHVSKYSSFDETASFSENARKQVVDATIKAFDNNHDFPVVIEDIHEYLELQVTQLQKKDAWLGSPHRYDHNQELRHDFGNMTVTFSFENYDPCKPHPQLMCYAGYLIRPEHMIGTPIDVDSTNTAKQLVSSAIKYFNEKQPDNVHDIRDYLESQAKQQDEAAPHLDRQIETANKAGYVQGVCESVLAFNTDDNRKIMSESAMTMLSKKLLSEMKVTQDMAQKYANPETYKALEQNIFAPKQEQAINRPRRWG